jgi:hypothetical protein
MMDKDGFKAVVAAVLEEQRRYILDEQRNQSRVSAEEAVQNVLLSFGIRKDDHRELRADFEHLRPWRRSVEQAGNYTVRAVITAVVGGVTGRGVAREVIRAGRFPAIPQGEERCH